MIGRGRMVKSDAERQRTRRLHIRADPAAYSLYLHAERDRKAANRASFTREDLLKVRSRGRVATKKWRQHNYMDQTEDTDGNIKTSTMTENSDQTESVPYSIMGTYKSRASFGKAKRRAERALPTSPGKKIAVLQKLATDILQVKIPSRRPASNKLPNVTRTCVETFYLSDSISRQMPGKADCVTVRCEDGSKEVRQQRHMIMTLAETFKIFQEENPLITIGKSSFATLRPKHVDLLSNMPHNVCGCRYHNNMILLLEALHKSFPLEVPLYSKDIFLKLCVCDISDEGCMINHCDVCSDSRLFNKNIREKIQDNMASIKWFQWQENSTGYLSKDIIQGTVTTCLDAVAGQLSRFLWHVFIKNHQARSYEFHKGQSQLSQSEECLLQMDFAENYTAVYQDEIQSAHWRQKQVSVYTIMVYHRNIVKSWVIVSDCRDHDKRAVVAYTNCILQAIKKDMPNVKTVNIWTDGPSSQYKNRFIFAMLSILETTNQLLIRWNYFATSHGKGPNDAIGGNVKRIVHSRVLARTAVVNDAASFAEVMKNSGSNIEVTVMSEQEIADHCENLQCDALWENTPIISGVQNTHYIAAIGSNEVLCKYYTSSDGEHIHNICAKQTKRPKTHSGSKSTEDGYAVKPNTKSSKVSKSLEKQKSKQEYPCKCCKWVYGHNDDPKQKEQWLE